MKTITFEVPDEVHAWACTVEFPKRSGDDDYSWEERDGGVRRNDIDEFCRYLLIHRYQTAIAASKTGVFY